MNTPPHQTIQPLNNPPPIVQQQQQQSDTDSDWSLASENFSSPPPSINSSVISTHSHFSHEHMPWNENNQEESSRPPNAMLNLVRRGVFVDLEYIQAPPQPQNNAILNVLQEANMISESTSE